MASSREIGASSMCGAKSVTLKSGESFPLLTLAIMLATSAAPHSVLIIGFRLPYLLRY